MNLTNKAIEGLRIQRVRLRMALTLGFSEVWMRKVINANKDNGPLTTAAALQVLREELGMTDDEILQEVQDTTTFPAKGFSIR